MPPNQAAYAVFFTPGVDWICGSRLYGSICVIDSRDATTRRSAPAMLPPLLKATRTESSRPNSRNAAITDSKVREVRVLLRNSADQMREKYFMAPSSVSGRRVGQFALVQVDGVGRV